MSSLSLTSLPNEILERIFMNLKLNDIKNISLVIESSSAVMNRVKIRWDDRHKEFKSSNRIYRNAVFTSVDRINTELSNFLMQASLTELDLWFCELKTSEFQVIMKSISKTIVKLGLNCMEFERDCKVVPVEFPTLQELKIFALGEDSALILNIFHGANVEILVDEDFISNKKFDYCSTFWRVIGSMEKLKDLTLRGPTFEIMNVNDALLNLNFKLEKLRSWNSLNSVIDENFLKFIEMQRTSLKEFISNGTQVTPQLLQLILNMPALTNVRLFQALGSTVSADRYGIVFSKNYSIKDLDIMTFTGINQNTERMIRDFITNCSALKKLELKVDCIASETLYVLANMNYLKNISLNVGSSFVPIAMPYVKELAISSNNPANVIEMIRLNTHLKKLIVSQYTTLHPDYQNAIAGLNPDAVIEVTEQIRFTLMLNISDLI